MTIAKMTKAVIAIIPTLPLMDAPKAGAADLAQVVQGDSMVKMIVV